MLAGAEESGKGSSVARGAWVGSTESLASLVFRVSFFSASPISGCLCLFLDLFSLLQKQKSPFPAPGECAVHLRRILLCALPGREPLASERWPVGSAVRALRSGWVSRCALCVFGCGWEAVPLCSTEWPDSPGQVKLCYLVRPRNLSWGGLVEPSAV